MPHSPFTEEWIQEFSDPYAVLGVSVVADDNRVKKRYRSVAKILHPDSQLLTGKSDREAAAKILAKLVNPAYQRLKQDKGRAETMAMLRFRVRRLTRDEPLNPQSESARRLLKTAVPDVEVFYEQAVTRLANAQYTPLEQFEGVTQELGELNLVYLRLKMGETILREKREGLISAPSPSAVEQAFSSAPVKARESATVSYAERHYQRAQEYLKKGNCPLAVQELRDAIRIEADQSRYYSLLAKAYLMQNLPGAAKAYCRKALELDQTDRLARGCARHLNIDVSDPNRGKKIQKPSSSEPDKSGGLFKGLFARKR